MVTRKSIFLIGANPEDFYDITYGALSNLKKSDCVIISKIHVIKTETSKHVKHHTVQVAGLFVQVH